ncbi:MAG: MoxR family ATPase [Cyanobacteria bacterium]|nr:MoxR family ATPase [Cyanobacteriota bacterium]
MNLTQEEASRAQAILEQLCYEMKTVIVGQDRFLERILIALIAHGHILVEGPPGLAKTLTLKCLAALLDLEFQRIQFTPDLMPSDLIGTRIYHPGTGSFRTELGPVMSHFVLADEINRAPAKVQSALLEAMQEGQVTIGRETHELPHPFFVMATQNPIDTEGTYPLPEAQLDRFLMKITLDYPTAQEEWVILQRMTDTSQELSLKPVLDSTALIQLIDSARAVYLDPGLMHWIVDFVQATRNTMTEVQAGVVNLQKTIRYGASPRGSLALAQCAKARALIRGRTYVIQEDIIELVLDCLRHRVILTYEGMARGETTDSVLNGLLAQRAEEN